MITPAKEKPVYRGSVLRPRAQGAVPGNNTPVFTGPYINLSTNHTPQINKPQRGSGKFCQEANRTFTREQASLWTRSGTATACCSGMWRWTTLYPATYTHLLKVQIRAFSLYLPNIAIALNTTAVLAPVNHFWSPCSTAHTHFISISWFSVPLTPLLLPFRPLLNKSVPSVPTKNLENCHSFLFLCTIFPYNLSCTCNLLEEKLGSSLWLPLLALLYPLLPQKAACVCLSSTQLPFKAGVGSTNAVAAHSMHFYGR